LDQIQRKTDIFGKSFTLLIYFLFYFSGYFSSKTSNLLAN